MSDLGARIDQTACDKLLSSVSYPFVVAERKDGFPGCSSLAAASDGGFYRYTDAEVDKLFAESVQFVISDTSRSDMTIHDQLYAFGGSIVQQAKQLLTAEESSEYEGPPRAQVETIIDDGIEKLGVNLRAIMGDWGLYAW